MSRNERRKPLLLHCPRSTNRVPSRSSKHPGAGHQAVFATTRWSVVLAAGKTHTPSADAALATLCEAYWSPLYAFIRRAGRSPHDAQDLTQDFISRLLAKNLLRAADPVRGRFRNFLLGALRHFLANEWDRANAIKRGGGHRVYSLDYASAESAYAMEALDRSAENVFDRRWALTLLDRGLEALREDYIRRGKTSLFEGLNGCLTGDRGTDGYAEIGRSLGMSEGAVKVAVHRLRSRYRQLLRNEIAQTVDTPEEVELELAELFRVVSR